MSRRLLVALAVVLAVPSAASGGRPGSWTRLDSGNAATAEPGLARTADGTLHLVWQRTSGPLRDEVVHQAISPAGALAGATTVVTQGWQSINAHVELAAAGTELRAFWAGVTSGLLSGPTVMASSQNGGATWGPPTAVTASKAGAAAAGLGAGVTSTGTVVAAQADAAAGTNVVRVVGGAEVPYETAGCCAFAPDVAVDALSGQLVLGWFSSAAGRAGLWTQAVAASGLVGARAAVPGSSTNGSATPPAQRTAITGRLGAGGVYVAYGAGYPAYTSVNLLRVGGSPVVVARGTGIEHVGIAPAPEGRLWLFWSRGSEYLATRSNRRATRFGTVTNISLPAADATTYGLYGEGSLGALDLVAHAGSGTAIPDWHTQVLPRLSLSVSTKTFERGGHALVRLTFHVTDVADAVSGARVTVMRRSVTTNMRGKATLLLRSTGKRVAVRATKDGYTAASTLVRLQ
jgi:hypothetical protein